MIKFRDVLLSLLISANSIAFSPKRPPSAPTPSPSSSASPTATAIPSATATPSVSPTPSAWYKTANGVDMRPCDNGIIENQQTPYCTSFALAAIMSNMGCAKDRYSVGHIWSFYREYSVDSASQSVPGHNITLWPYWGETATKGASSYLQFANHQITAMEYIDTSDDLSEVIKELDMGHPVYVGLQVSKDMASCYSNVRATSGYTSGGHALPVLGYSKDSRMASGGYLIIKQSWGDQCGDHGFQYIDFGLIKRNDGYFYFYRVKGFK